MHSEQSTASGFWNALAQSGGCALLSEWRSASGTDWLLLEPWLCPTDRVAEVCRCLSEPPCECVHELVETWHGWMARCVCDPPQCAPMPFEPAGRMLWKLDEHALQRQIAAALGLVGDQAREPEPALSNLRFAGHLPSGAPAYLDLHPGLGSERQWLMILMREPEAVMFCLEPRTLSRAVSLESLLQPRAGRQFAGPLRPVEQCVGPSQASSATTRALEELRRELARLRKAVPASTQPASDLRQLGKELTSFTGRIDASSFQILCAVLATGDVAKASRQLRIPDATVRSVIKGWRGQGAAYKTMVDLVRWRKQVGRRETVRLNESIFAAQTSSTDYAGLLADVLEHLLDMTEDNWEARSRELTDLLRPYALT